MAVLVKILNRGMTLDMYDQIATPILAEIKRQAGFQIHACYATGDGLIVTEVWDTAEQQRAWFEKYVRPNIPADADQEFDVVELHNVATK